MDGETTRAMLAVQMWAVGSATVRAKKPASDFLPAADDLLKRSYALGSPLSEEPPNVLLDASEFAAQRFRDWFDGQSPETKAWVRQAVAGV